ncbi:MAG: exo-alpha-sialidase [Planctomycetes bacterium]|nr:exo-alpha-sialidase [Planctomycetota bacterium]
MNRAPAALAIGMAALTVWALSGTARANQDSLPLKIGDGGGWSFLGGPWTEDVEGVIRPPDRRNLHSRAFYRAQGFKDLTAEFEFNANYRETGSGSAGLILRAADANHFYLVYFPWGGQQLRAMHFWAILAKVEGDGYLRNLAARWVPGVPSETDRWYKVRVVAKGPQITVWVDGRLAIDVTDNTHESGCVGLAGYGWYFFRNIRISGASAEAPAWKDSAPIPSHSFTVGFNSENMPTGCVAPNGDVLLAAGSHLVRSRDGGQTWSQPAALPEKLGPLTDYGSTLYRTSKGRLMVMVYRTQEQIKKPVPEILISDSADNGHNWSDPEPAKIAPDWPAEPAGLVPYGPLVEAGDGSLSRFLLGGVEKEGRRYTSVRTWGATHCKAFAIRSADDGKTWSAPIELDRTKWSGTPRGDVPGSLDFTEPAGVAIGNIITVLIRPIYSPMMWQCWSSDGGASYDAAARATFPGYAQSMIRTRSGAILCAHRYPHYSINLSHDHGLNWDEGTVIDYAFWGMGCLVEVEPNLVLCAYMNWNRDQSLLVQIIRVTPEGLKPVPRKT